MTTAAFSSRLEHPEAEQAAVAQDVLACHCTGQLSVSEYLASMELSRICCKTVTAFARTSVQRHLQGT